MLEQFDPYLLQDHVEFSCDGLGRAHSGSFGHAIARDYIHSQVEELGLTPILLDGGFTQTYVNEPIHDRFQLEEDGSISRRM